MGLFDTASTFDPASFNYTTEKDKLDRKKALLQLLQRQAMDGTKPMVVAGFKGDQVIAPSKFSALANLASMALSMKGLDGLSDAQAGLDKSSQDALAYQLGHLSDKVEQPSTARRLLVDDGATFGEGKSPVRFGEPSVQPESQAISSPVRRGSMDVTDLPPVTQVGTKQKKALASAMRGALPGTSVSPDDIALASAAFGSPKPAAPTAPTPVMTSAPATQPSASQSVSAQPMAYSTGLQGMAHALGQNAPTMDKAITEARDPNIGETLSRLNAIANSGPMGKTYAEQQLMQIFGDKNGQYKVEIAKGPDGSVAAVRVNTRTGEVTPIDMGGNSGKGKPVGTHDTPQGLVNIFADGTSAPVLDPQGKPVMGANGQKQVEQANSAETMLTNTRASIGRMQTSINDLRSLVPNATGMSGQIGRLWNDTTGSATDASKFDAMVHNLKSNQFMLAINQLKQMGNGSSGLGGLSDSEGARLEGVLAAIDPKRLGAEGTINALNSLSMELQQALQNSEAQYARQQAGNPAAQGAPTRQPGTAPSPISYNAFRKGQ